MASPTPRESFLHRCLDAEIVLSNTFQLAARSLSERCAALEAALPSQGTRASCSSGYGICIIDGGSVQFSKACLRDGGDLCAFGMGEVVREALGREVGAVRVAVYVDRKEIGVLYAAEAEEEREEQEEDGGDRESEGAKGEEIRKEEEDTDEREKNEGWERFIRTFNAAEPSVELIDVPDPQARALEVLKLHLAERTCRGILFGGQIDDCLLDLMAGWTHSGRTILAFEGDTPAEEVELEGGIRIGNPFVGLFRATRMAREASPPTEVGQATTRIISSSVDEHQGGNAGVLAEDGLEDPMPPANHPIKAEQAPRIIPESPPKIQFDASGNRVDVQYSTNGTLINAITALHLCNNHYLRGSCTYQGCRHRHDIVLQLEELDTLRHLGRRLRCRNGRQCADGDCYAGHLCPNVCCDGKSCGFPLSWHKQGALGDGKRHQVNRGKSRSERRLALDDWGTQKRVKLEYEHSSRTDQDRGMSVKGRARRQ